MKEVKELKNKEKNTQVSEEQKKAMSDQMKENAYHEIKGLRAHCIMCASNMSKSPAEAVEIADVFMKYVIANQKPNDTAKEASEGQNERSVPIAEA